MNEMEVSIKEEGSEIVPAGEGIASWGTGSPAAEAVKPEEAGAEVQDTEEPKGLSKNQQKKQAKLKYFADTRAEWKAAKQEKKRAAKQRKREEAQASAALQSGSQNSGAGVAGAGAGAGAKRKAANEGEGEVVGGSRGGSIIEGEVDESEPTIKKKKKQKTQTVRTLEPITLIMDCGFDEKMNDKEIISMSSQLTRCYAVNRLSTRQVSLRVTSLNGRLLERYRTVINNQHLRWKGVEFSDVGYEVTEENKNDLIYLTADSPDTIEDLEAGKSYIIGGIVDRNRYKSLCYDKAVKQGIRTAKLPIGDYIKMSSRFVLTTNQVVEIMLKYLECRDWKEAFMEVIPQRKQPKLKPGESGEQDGEDGQGQEEQEEQEEQEGEAGEKVMDSEPDNSL